MNPELLVVVESDPRTGARAAEAIRIAAGVGAWKKAGVTVYLHGPAVSALTEFPDELVDEDNFTRYLPIIGDFGRPVLVQRGSALLGDLGTAALPYREIDDDELARIAARSMAVMRF
jgi:hypothetical protein